MVKRYRRARRGRRSVMRKRVRGGKRLLVPRMFGVHRFKETCQLAQLTAAASGTNSGTITFSLTDLFNIASFKNLFDLFKITGVKIKLVPQFNVATADTSATPLPMIYVAENRSPFVPAPTSVGDILNDDGVKVIRGGRIVSMYLKNPKCLILDTSPDGTITTQASWQLNSSSNALQPWLPTGGNGQAKDATSWKHYGYRYLIDNTQNTHSPVSWNVFATYYFSMKEQD